jgi:hypothetical protein
MCCDMFRSDRRGDQTVNSDIFATPVRVGLFFRDCCPAKAVFPVKDTHWFKVWFMQAQNAQELFKPKKRQREHLHMRFLI